MTPDTLMAIGSGIRLCIEAYKQTKPEYVDFGTACGEFNAKNNGGNGKAQS